MENIRFEMSLILPGAVKESFRKASSVGAETGEMHKAIPERKIRGRQPLHVNFREDV